MAKLSEVPAAVTASARKIQLPDGSRSFKSLWVWRGLFMMSLIALGLALTLLVGDHIAYAACWGVIALGWFAVSMFIWRQNVRYYR